MAEVFAPFPIQGTMCNLTFYMVEGRNFVRTKSSLKNENSIPLHKEPKRAYRKSDTVYWQRKTLKAARRKARKEQTLYHAGILARASKIGSKLYRHLSGRNKCGSTYRQLTAWAMQLVKDGWDEADIIAGLVRTLPDYLHQKCLPPVPRPSSGGLLIHPKG